MSSQQYFLQEPKTLQVTCLCYLTLLNKILITPIINQTAQLI
jgi:hypothetical protein